MKNIIILWDKNKKQNRNWKVLYNYNITRVKIKYIKNSIIFFIKVKISKILISPSQSRKIKEFYNFIKKPYFLIYLIEFLVNQFYFNFKVIN